MFENTNCSIYLFHLKVENWLAEMANFDLTLAQIEDIGFTYESRKQRIIKVPQLKKYFSGFLIFFVFVFYLYNI